MQIIIKNTNKYLDVTENKLYDVIGYIDKYKHLNPENRIY